MANRRVINCDIFEDEWYGLLEFFEQQLWIGLFARMADDQGRLLDNPIAISNYVFLYKSVDPKNVNDALDKFFNDGKIIRYKKDGKKLIQIKRWWENQKPQWANESKYPPPDGWSDRIRTRLNNKYIVKNWGVDPDNFENIPEGAPEGAPETKSARHVPVPVPVPDPIPVPVPIPDINASAIANFFSEFQSIAGPVGGNTQAEQLKDLLKENGAKKILEIARWLVEDKGETSMFKIIAAIRTSAPKWNTKNNDSVFEEWINGNKRNSDETAATVEQASSAVQTHAGNAG